MVLDNDIVCAIRSATGRVKRAGLDHKRSIPQLHHSLQTKIADRRSCAAVKNLNMNRISSEGSLGVYSGGGAVIVIVLDPDDVEQSSSMERG